MTGSGGVPGIDRERARAYVLAHGDMRARARLAGMLDGARPEPALVHAIEQLQQADGAFVGAGAGGVGSTCAMLFELKDLPPLAGSPMASRAVAFLRRVQAPDGSWGSQGAEQVALTALATYALLVFDPGHLDPIMRGSGWLRRTLGPNGAGAASQTLACAAAIWYRVLGPAAREVSWCFEVAKGRDMTAPDLAFWLWTALEIGVGGQFVLPLVATLSRLAALQGTDGAWGTGPGSAADPVETTLQALRALRGYGVA